MYGIEVGCGPATDGKYLRQKGLVPVSVDYSEAMLALAKQADPDADVRLMDIYDLEFAQDTFEWFWATACLLHLERPTDALEQLQRVTRSGGYGVVTVKEGVGELIDQNTGYYFHYFSDKGMSQMFTSSKMQVVRRSRKNGGQSGYDWLTYVVQIKK